MSKAAALLFAAAAVTAAQAQTAIRYQKPPAPIEALLDAPQTPIASVSPDRKTLLIQQPQDFPTIADVAEPRLRLAGLRFNTATSGPSRTIASIALKLQPTTPGTPARPIAGLPAPLRATEPLWSPDSKQVAFIQRTLGVRGASSKAAPSLKQNSAGLDLYLIDVATARAHRVGTVHLNAVLGAPCAWMPDSSALACNIVSPTRGAAPKISDIPTGPDVSENLGRVSPAPTYEDMLKTPADEQLFEFYATAQLAIVPAGLAKAGTLRLLPVKGLLNTPSPSPDGRFLLLSELHRPFSYTVPADSFPLKTSVLTLKTGALKVLNDRPLIDNLPISRDATVAGPRGYEWRSDAAATLVWAEAADGGIPKPAAQVADRLYTFEAPFEAQPTLLYEAPMRLAGRRGSGIEWGTDHLALVSMARFSDRRSAIVAIDPSAPGKSAATLYQGSSQDRYNAPGRPLTQRNAAGQPILTLTPDAQSILFVSQGASPKGDQPFLAALPVAGGPKQILFRSADPFYADPIALLTPTTLLVRRESATESPNYYVAQLSSEPTSQQPLTQLTTFPSPYAGQTLPTKQLLKYKRADGLDLTATLWLPAGYSKSQGPLPTLMEAYPAEFKSRATAAQVAGSPNRFPRIGWGSPVFFAQTGYAVLENAAIPIIGEGDAQPNDTYTEQLVAAAKAAIDYGASLGVVDPSRVAVMGHSYGAFMTANLLAHSTLFRAGIARSGAYNRTLTPYGFQNRRAHLLAGPPGLQRHVPLRLRRQDQNPHPPHPRRSRRQHRHLPYSIRALLRRPQRPGSHRPPRLPPPRSPRLRSPRVPKPHAVGDEPLARHLRKTHHPSRHRHQLGVD